VLWRKGVLNQYLRHIYEDDWKLNLYCF
jgi:hypothetical protein